jgi:hypothetical protein
LSAFIQLLKWRGDASCYGVLFAYFAALREGSQDKAKLLLGEAARRCNTAAWPYGIVQHLRGEIDETALLGAAHDTDNGLTDVHRFLGLKSLNEKNESAARTHFQWVVDHIRPPGMPYVVSSVELDRLAGK